MKIDILLQKVNALQNQVNKYLNEKPEANSERERQFYKQLQFKELIAHILVLAYYKWEADLLINPESNESKSVKDTIFQMLVSLTARYAVLTNNILAIEPIVKNLTPTQINDQFAFAIEENNVDLLEALIAIDVNINDKILIKDALVYPVVYGISLNHIDIVTAMISRGANINLPPTSSFRFNFYDCGPWIICLQNKNEASIKMLECLLSIPNITLDAHKYYGKSYLEFALQAAAEHGELGCKKATLFLNKQASLVNTLKRVDFYNAIIAGEEVVMAVLKAGYKYNIESLCDVIKFSDSLQLTQSVLKLFNESDINEAKATLSERYNFSEVQFYIAIGDREQAKKLITESDLSPEVNARAILLATKLNQTDVLQALLEKNPNGIDSTDENGMSPLMYAAQAGQKENVALLLKHNAKVNQQVADGKNVDKTALFLATEKAHLDVIQMLLNTKLININLGPKDKWNKINSACDCGLNSSNEAIKNAYFIKMAEPSIDEIKLEIDNQIKHFKKQGQSFFGIGNNKKAKMIRDALNRANTHSEATTTMDNFLYYKEGNKQSILDAFDYHRIGFFGHTRSYNKMSAVADTVRQKYKRGN